MMQENVYPDLNNIFSCTFSVTENTSTQWALCAKRFILPVGKIQSVEDAIFLFNRTNEV